MNKKIGILKGFPQWGELVTLETQKEVETHFIKSNVKYTQSARWVQVPWLLLSVTILLGKIGLVVLNDLTRSAEQFMYNLNT